MSDEKYSLQIHPKHGYLQVSPTPTQEEITKFYADEFYSTQYSRFNNSSLEVQQKDREFHDSHRDDICESIERLLGEEIKGKAVLDVGCGWAETLSYFKKRGADCYGFDPAIEAVEYAQKYELNVVRAGIETIDVFEGKRFDVVMLLNVLEHLSNPEAVLKEIGEKVIKDGGVLVIEVPNEFNAFQVCGQKLHSLDEWWVAPPGHLNYFNNTTLTSLLDGSGFDVKKVLSTFPLEMFLLFGENYVSNGDLGRLCHEKRMAFEMNLKKFCFGSKLTEFYEALAAIDLGRQLVSFSVLRKGK